MLLIEADLSPAMARTARAKEPIPAERMAAAPEPFVRARVLGEAALPGVFIFLLPVSVESYDRPELARTYRASRQRNRRHLRQQTKLWQSRAPRHEGVDGS